MDLEGVQWTTSEYRRLGLALVVSGLSWVVVGEVEVGVERKIFPAWTYCNVQPTTSYLLYFTIILQIYLYF